MENVVNNTWEVYDCAFRVRLNNHKSSINRFSKGPRVKVVNICMNIFLKRVIRVLMTLGHR